MAGKVPVVFVGVDDPLGFIKLAHPLTIKTQSYAFWAPDRFEKPSHARAPAISTRTCEPRGQSAFGGEAADDQGARSKQNCAVRGFC